MEDKSGSTPEEEAQSRRAFIKKMTYVAPAMVTYKVGESWADDDDGGGGNGKKNQKNQKGASPNPGLSKKYRVEDDD